MPPKEFFQKGGYSKFDAEGLPTHDKDGKEISKKMLQVNKKKNDQTQS